jgi:LAS superfamily LD-carboxypeptidase LdcB
LEVRQHDVLPDSLFFFLFSLTPAKMHYMQNTHTVWQKILTALCIISILAIAGLCYVYLQTNARLTKTETDLAITSEALQEKITNLETIILATQTENTTITEALTAAQSKSKDLEEQFEKVNDNVETLEKITTTDPELLQKYSKIYFLNEHYAPADIQTIDSEYTYRKDVTYKIHDDVWPYLEDLLDAAKKDNLSLQIISAFRSFSDQAELKGAYSVTYGAGTANQFSADQGYSEHQLGTTVDFTTPTVRDTFSGFAATPEYAWLQDNAHEYGFTLSYPKDNTYYQFEPWHWRFVGVKLATYLHKKDKHFYDLTQREIDEYVVDLFE